MNTHEFDNYDGFSSSTTVSPFDPNYVYATTHNLISRSLSIAAILPAAYIIDLLVRYCINGLSSRNRPMDDKKLRRLLTFNQYNVVAKILEDITQIGGFNQRLPMRQSNKRFPYGRPCKHKYDVINAFFYYVKSHNGTTTVELISGTKTLLTDVYAIGTKSGLNDFQITSMRIPQVWQSY